MTDKGDLIETVANTLIERLENFSGEWEKPFFTFFARNVATQKAYRGINILILNFAAVYIVRLGNLPAMAGKRLSGQKRREVNDRCFLEAAFLQM